MTHLNWKEAALVAVLTMLAAAGVIAATPGWAEIVLPAPVAAALRP